MSQTVELPISRLELDRAFHYAVTLAWDDLTKWVEPCSMRSGIRMCAWRRVGQSGACGLFRARGYQDLVCECWTQASLAHSGGAFFSNQQHSDKLAGALGFILENQDLFTRLTDACRHGLVLIYPPDAEDRAEACNWMTTIQAAGREQGSGEPLGTVAEEHRQQEEALSRMDDEGYPSERGATLLDATRILRTTSGPPPSQVSAANVVGQICPRQRPRRTKVPDVTQVGRIFIRSGTTLPGYLQFESEPYAAGWRSVTRLDGAGLGRQIHDAGWTFFCLAGETKKRPPSALTEERRSAGAVAQILAAMKVGI